MKTTTYALLCAAALAAAPLAHALPFGTGATAATALSAQERPGAESGATRCAPPWMALGIGRISCTNCSLSWGAGVEPAARFGTEPEIFPLEDRVGGGDAVVGGDRLVAVDGELITTAAGVRRILAVREGDVVRLSVRRDGRARELRVVAGDACSVELPAPAPAPRAPRPPVVREPVPAPDPAPTPRPGGSVGRAPSPLPAPLPTGPGAAPRPLPAPPAPGEMLPAARLGFGFTCDGCGFRSGRWWFEEPPAVTGVERDGPAWAAGFRTGDEVVAIDGHPLTSEEGARAFSAIEPGDRVRWSLRRDGRTLDVTLTATPKTPRPEPAPASPTAPAPPTVPTRGGAVGTGSIGTSVTTETLRYTGRLGGTDVEVRGAPVSVSVDETTGVVVIRTSDAIIRLTRVGGG